MANRVLRNLDVDVSGIVEFEYELSDRLFVFIIHSQRNSCKQNYLIYDSVYRIPMPRMTVYGNFSSTRVGVEYLILQYHISGISILLYEYECTTY